MQESILELAEKKVCWQEFLDYKKEKQKLSKSEENEIEDFIKREAYAPLCADWKKGNFPSTLPVKSIVNKEGTGKKRVVYSYRGDEGIFLKFVAFGLYRYDEMFYDNCYAFRRGTGVGSAIRRLQISRIDYAYCLKADIQNYFNSINPAKMMEMLDFMREEETLYSLFERILLNEKVLEGDKIVKEAKGIMAGTPFAPFLANVYLRDVDAYFKDMGVLYFRYSDDILLFADSEQELLERKKKLFEMLALKGLSLNPEKVKIYNPGEEIEFLGFGYQKGRLDLSANTIRKTKAKIRRKAEALRRWQRKRHLAEEKAAIGFVRAMNRKFFGKDREDEFTWQRWFFPYLTTDEGLKEIDAYMQQYIRYAVTGRHYKGNYRIRYETMKEWGYRSLVNEYYKQKGDKDKK